MALKLIVIALAWGLAVSDALAPDQLVFFNPLDAVEVQDSW
ncbi:MAG: hypothetical protein AAGH78_09345 [Cyanobacteria bacterium P01_H01_bin.58]